ncbi:MAG: hypothetical protein LBQ54_08205 [Planctomycetaceae bacterium]|jgi:hypothetical protein|nr:hypothetical protein [Planctomycetaceae bacterium]
MNRIRILSCCIFSGLIFFSTGCPNNGTFIKGNVTFNDSPVAKGSITFFPEGGNAPTVGGPVTNGYYTLKLTPGKYKVRIVAERSVGQRTAGTEEVDAGTVHDVMEQYIPSKYNKRTELSVTVKENGTFDFPLKTQ